MANTDIQVLMKIESNDDSPTVVHYLILNGEDIAKFLDEQKAKKFALVLRNICEATRHTNYNINADLLSGGI